ncbi:TolC family protein [Deinococcus sp. KNUC1210]|uniref:TolC family protein n=1 Tax=Deinococcus sp. KNUC1210 TaxID=2917691 RepID=UPI001EEFC1BC|nr:TolC family protein [Deinococcus sp. KNUC1210]ULH15470.1 TolC family protein [Deinococcus sp. KNUC1210]
MSVAAPAAPTILTLQQAFAALQQAPGWRSAALQYQSAQQNLDAARARAGLSLSAGADVTAVKAPIDSGSLGASVTVSAQAAINVLPWSSAQDSIRQATRALYRAGLDQRDAQNQLAITAAQTYLTILQDQAALALAQAQLGVAQRGLEVARAQQQSGTLTQENVLDKQAAQEQAQNTLDNARSALDTAVRQLFNTLGLTAPDPSSVQFSGAAPVPAAPAPLDTITERALLGRSEVLKARSNLEDAQAALSSAQRDRNLPNVSVSAQLGQFASASSTTTSSNGNTLSSSLNFKTGALSASASLPLSSSSLPYSLALGLSGSVAILDPSGDATLHSAQTSVQSAQLSLQSAIDSVKLDVQQKYAQAQNALSGLTAPRTALQRAQVALASTQARLQAGLATALDVQQAQLAVQQAQNTLDTAVENAYLASITLSSASSEFSPALIQLVPSALAPGSTLSASTLPVSAVPSSTVSTDSLPGGQP